MKTEVIDKIVIIKKQDKKVLHDLYETRTIHSQLYIVSIIGKRGKALAERDYSTNDIASLLERVTNLDSITIDNIVKKFKDEILLSEKWMEITLEQKEWKLLNKFMSGYKIVIYDFKYKKLNEGEYSYCRMEYLDEDDIYRNILSQYPIEYKKKEKLQYKYKKKAVSKNNNSYKINAAIMLDIIYKILPAFYVSNVENGLSFINETHLQTKIFPAWFNLVLKYPENYLDLNGQKNDLHKILIKNGVLKDLIGVGDKIVLDDMLNKQFGVLGIESLYEYSEMKKEYIDVNAEKTCVFCDVQKGNIIIDLYGVCNEKIYKKYTQLSIVDFFDRVVYAGGKTNMYGHLISNIIIQI